MTSKWFLPSEHWSKLIKCSKEHYSLGHHFIVRLGSFIQYQFISMFFMLFPMKRLGKWNYFTQTVQIKRINTDKNNLYMTWTQNWEVPVSCQWCHTKAPKRAHESSASNSVGESFIKLTAHSITKLFMQIMFV